MTLVDRVLLLSSELRSQGADVSVAETRDALLALSEVPLIERALVLSALRATLAKDPGSRTTLDRLFEVLFPAGRLPAQTNPVASEAAAELHVSEQLGRALRERDEDEMRRLAAQLVAEQADVRPGARVSDDHYRYRALRHIDLEDLIQRLVDEEVSGRGVSMLERRLIEDDLRARMDRFADDVAEEIRMRRRQGRSLQEQLGDERGVPPEEVDFIWATEAHLEAYRRVLAPLARRLALKMTRRRRRAHSGRLDVRRTLRRSLGTGGALADPAFRKPLVGKPELWVLCDISGSMRSFARFCLELFYTLSTQFRQVRSFVFIDDIDEVTVLLTEAPDLAGALDRIDSEAQVVSYDGQSWYGNCFTRFRALYGHQLSARATVLILGDARNNNRSSGAEHLAEIKRTARRVWWLNPEPKIYWDSADSIASRFEPHTHGMVECSNLRQLEHFVARVL
jgi:uncharacterized protein with von Willebrand factor type A (vWA) domain